MKTGDGNRLGHGRRALPGREERVADQTPRVGEDGLEALRLLFPVRHQQSAAGTEDPPALAEGLGPGPGVHRYQNPRGCHEVEALVIEGELFGHALVELGGMDGAGDLVRGELKRIFVGIDSDEHCAGFPGRCGRQQVAASASDVEQAIARLEREQSDQLGDVGALRAGPFDETTRQVGERVESRERELDRRRDGKSHTVRRSISGLRELRVKHRIPMKATNPAACDRAVARPAHIRAKPGLLRRGLASLALAALAGCTQEGPRPDVLLVTIDTLRSDHCSAYGYPIDTTPHLTALASRGVLYRRAYAESSTTAPSHAVLLTSRHFRTLGVGKNGEQMSDDAVTLAETLASQGYDTAAFVSSFPLLKRFGFAQGFDHYDDRFVIDEASLGRRAPGSTPHDRLAGATLAHTEKWLADRNSDDPLFLWVHFVDPHAPYRAPQRFEGKWPEGTKTIVQRYDTEVRYADEQLGRLLELFRAESPERDDLVVVTSDHGEGLGDHGWMSHGVNLHEEAVRVPLVASWPGHLPEGKVVEEAVSIVDVSRSILDSLGIEAKTFAHGRNVFAGTDPSRAIFLQRRTYSSRKEKGQSLDGEMTAVVERDSKLILSPREKKRELYDLRIDPTELRNLVGPPPKRRRRGDDKAAIAALPPPVGTLDDQLKSAHRLEEHLANWERAFPSTGEDTPLDEETKKALRSLGYVD
jgi:arylsulfatase A-like enzyme